MAISSLRRFRPTKAARVPNRKTKGSSCTITCGDFSSIRPRIRRAERSTSEPTPRDISTKSISMIRAEITPRATPASGLAGPECSARCGPGGEQRRTAQSGRVAAGHANCRFQMRAQRRGERLRRGLSARNSTRSATAVATMGRTYCRTFKPAVPGAGGDNAHSRSTRTTAGRRRRPWRCAAP